MRTYPKWKTKAQQLCRKNAEWTSKAPVLFDFSNVFATNERLGELAPEEAERLLNEARARVRGAANVPAMVARHFARRHSVSTYDARIPAAAEALGAKLVTEDTKLRRAAPALAQSLAEATSHL